MKSKLRAAAAIALGMFAALALVGPAAAAVAPSDDCARQDAGYAAAGVCQLTVKVATPVCDNNVPMLRYQVLAEGTSNPTVTITWMNPSGANVVAADQPLSGSVPWPGAVVGSDGQGVGWPGWIKQADGTWVKGGPFGWTRPSVQVAFKVGTEATSTVSYPPSSPVCLTEPAGSSVLGAEPNAAGAVPVSRQVVSASSQVLSATGSNTAPVLLLAGGLVLVGAGVLITLAVLRRRQAA